MMIHACVDDYPNIFLMPRNSTGQTATSTLINKSRAGLCSMSRVRATTGLRTKLTFRSNNVEYRDERGFLWRLTEHKSRQPFKEESRSTCTGPKRNVLV